MHALPTVVPVLRSVRAGVPPRLPRQHVHARRFETDLSAAADAPGGRGAAVRTLKRVLPATAQQARDVEKFCPRHYSIE